ncbi:ABC transporter ATP-binding protein [Streptomyces europaeiscabiei]|uniref:ABC transporter ATP-binding protein n=3 Tax=Streptomyces europaeiscabiei TaxID=146819 RepID=A0ABU4NRX3_9ACTN|nr:MULTISPECIES: ABC transporter ATP-binding protein [Streptomyces]MDX2531129.1 ABC transporter ATP-binding protein [Streptomyces europaeiscabiei]MDX2759250.1 ABC transporter ATP-binding protein [Streptomyces europaeiscabiei]MDX3549935.1 ABC transporter ATP-binding protein [Streptomyces europaeiscabiei]MDX3557382.1 ABC transporter ATP-binding protein [Streptomyces europaeiscabiei]MDX3672941.1 ABC transporter ATP-binding protein [Streptomyces europaeiscabiei]
MIDAHEDPGTPDCRSGSRYLWWLVRQQAGRSALGSLISCVWMILLAATPYLLSRAIDEGLEPGDHPALARWTAALFGVGAFNAWLSVMRHRTMTRVRMDANFRTVKVVMAHAVRLGAALPRRVGAGEVVTIGVGDVNTISSSLTVIGPGVGAFAAYLVVAGLLVSVSLPIAAVVLLGMPLMAVIVGPLMRRLQGTETEYRERQGVLTARIADLAGGLRVLNGLGGKGLVADAFHRDSQRLRAQGYRVGAVTSWMQALGVGLPTLFLAVVTWLAARLAAQGAITVGELVAVYGYVTVLVRPVSYFVAWGYELSRGVVAARRVIRFVTLEPLPDHGTTDAPAEPSALHDPESGVRVPPGRLVALAADRPAEAAAVVDRLGRYAPTAATWGRTPLDAIPLAQVRARILVADHEADLFAGRLRDLLGGHGDVDDATAARALRAAVAEDIVQGLPDGLGSAIDARGRNLSGGQRQRVRLARALVADPEILLAVEPTSALDAHTEARVAQRLRAAREGRTTLVTTTSPLVLDHADTVLHLVDGKVAAAGTHRELLAGEPGYRALVARDAGEEDGPGEEDGTGQDGTGQEDGSGREADPDESTVEEVAR